MDQEVPQGEMVTFRCVHRFGWSYIWRSGRLRSEINDHRKVHKCLIDFSVWFISKNYMWHAVSIGIDPILLVTHITL